MLILRLTYINPISLIKNIFDFSEDSRFLSLSSEFSSLSEFFLGYVPFMGVRFDELALLSLSLSYFFWSSSSSIMPSN
jgi:hypothetical protein